MKSKFTLRESLDMLNSLPAMGTEEYSYHVQELIDNLKSVKSTLKSGPDRKNYRKESGNLQRAIEALRYLNRRNQRLIKTESINLYNTMINLKEYQEANIGSTKGVPRCNLTKTLRNMTNISLKTAANIDDLFGGFIPYYLCDAAEAVTEEFKDYFINPIKDFKNAIKDVTFGLTGMSVVTKLNPASKRNKGFEEESSAREIIYKKYTETDYSNFSLTSFVSSILDPKLLKDPTFKGALTNIRNELSTGLNAQLETVGEDAVDKNTTTASYYQTFARAICNHIIGILNREAGYSIDKITK